MSLSVESLLLLFSLLLYMVQGLSPHGCVFDDGAGYCDFRRWFPPLLDTEFGPGPMYRFRLGQINGTIPAGALRGLNGPPAGQVKSVYFDCYGGTARLSRHVFTRNLHWVTAIRFLDCYLENGLQSRLLETLKSLQHLKIIGGGIEGVVAQDSLTGLTSLQAILINSPIKAGTLPARLFYGLNNLAYINLNHAKLDFIPSHLFYGLVSIETISLYGNYLQTLPPGLFDKLSSLTYVEVADNPWNCSCELMRLLDWSHITGAVGCQSPSVVQNVKLEDAFGILNCTSSTTTVLPTTVSSATENSERHASPISTRDADATSVSSALYGARNSNSIVNDLRSIILISTIGLLTVLLVAATVFFRYGCRRNKCCGSIDRVDVIEEDRHDPNRQRQNRSGSNSSPGLQPNV